jgi:hypothetical protein
MHRAKVCTFPLGRMIRQVFTIVAAGMLWVPMSSAQGVGGSVSGRVTDPSGAIIPGVHVSAQDMRTGVGSGTQSDASGYYTLQLQPKCRPVSK